MSVTDSVIKIAKWLNNGVCKKFKFKKPPEEGQPVNDEYEEIHPYAFPIFMPARDKLPPGIECNMPSVIVQIMEGEDDIAQGKRELAVNLAISCWNPGTHSKDVYYPNAPDMPEKYRSTYDGWMDAWNFTDAILRALESVASIDGIKLQRKISFGTYKEQGSIADYYPLWFAWIRFTIQTDFIRNCEEYEEFL